LQTTRGGVQYHASRSLDGSVSGQTTRWQRSTWRDQTGGERTPPVWLPPHSSDAGEERNFHEYYPTGDCLQSPI